jgi:hypothetical protein
MPTLDLTDDEKLALVSHLRQAIEYDPFPYAAPARPAESDPGQARSPSAAARTATFAKGRGDTEHRARATVVSDQPQCASLITALHDTGSTGGLRGSSVALGHLPSSATIAFCRIAAYNSLERYGTFGL